MTLIASLSAFVAPISVVTALLVYAAWTRTKTFFEYFGVDSSVLGLSPQDYLFRSADTAFGVLVWIAVGCTAVLFVSRVSSSLLKNLEDDAKRNRLRCLVAWFAIACIVFGLVATLLPVLAIAITPYGVVAILMGASLVLLGTRRSLGFARRSLPEYLTLAILIVVIVSAGFWGATVYARDLGTAEAVNSDDNPRALAEVDLLSGQPLDITGDLVTRASVNLTPSKTAYRYIGLRLLEYANSRWLLLTGHRQGMHASVLLLKDSDDIRLEIIEPPQ